MIKISLEQFQSREDWLKFRRSGIGGSDASVIVGMSKYKTKAALWLDKTNQTPVVDEEKEVTYWGHTMEPIIREEFAKRSGLPVRVLEYAYRSSEHAFMIADLDGEVEDALHGTCVFEAKTVSAYKRDDWAEGVPPEYYLQVQHYMAVTGYQGAYVAALIGGNEFIYRFVERDDDTIKHLVRLEFAFWIQVQNRIEPEIDGSEAMVKYLNAKYAAATIVEKIDLGEAGLKLIEEYDRASEAFNAAKEEKDRIANCLKNMLGEHVEGYSGSRKVSWKPITSRRMDSDRLKMNDPALYERYCNDVICRRFTVSKGA